MFGGYFEMNLSATQQEIVDTRGNMIVSASAGTGKTLTLVAKIAKELNDNHSHKVIAAITFTVKAAKEIRKRLTFDTSEQFIGTNNSFAIEEIIKPFARDVYGSEFKINMSTDYSIKKDTFQECLNYLREEKTICSYIDNKKNFVFELALEIMKKSLACRLFLKSKYFKVYVDEYQDCDKSMHEFFMYLCNCLSILLFVVGDEKQSIYIWRGAYPNAFKSILKMKNFQKKILWENYRSCQQIQNYSNLLSDKTRHLYKPLIEKSEIVYIKARANNWVKAIKPYLDLNEDCALLRFSNENARKGAQDLYETGTSFTFVPKTPISEITTDVSWLYNAIAQYCIVSKYSIYDFMDEIPEESIGDKRIKNFIQNKLELLEKALNEKKDSEVLNIVKDIASYFGYSCSDEHIKAMISTINNQDYYPAFHIDELHHIAITFHSSKGLEYEQVIVFANDFPLDSEVSIYNHYVAVTRAKSKLIIVNIIDANLLSYGIKYCNGIKRLLEKADLKPEDVMKIV